MKKSFSLAIVTFFLSLGVGFLIQQSWVAAILRSLISAVGVFLAYRAIFIVIQHFLPELLMHPDSGFEGFTSDRPIESDLASNIDLSNDDSEVATLSSSVGQKLDVTLDDQGMGSVDTSSMNFAPLSSPSADSERPQSNLEKQKQVFLREDPAVLAKMVRTRLSDDD
ncbi:MAG: hypothetical protein ACRCVN_02210 [Spirochaetia bacterium]